MAELHDKILMRAEKSHRKGKFKKEIRLLEHARKLCDRESDKADIDIRIGTALSQLGRGPEAKEYYFRALDQVQSLPADEKDELYWSINDYLGTVFYEEGDYQEALRYKMEAVKDVDELHEKSAWMLLTYLGKIHEHLEDYEKALEWYLRALEIEEIDDDELAMTMGFCGQCHDGLGDEARAYESYHKAFSLDPGHTENWHMMYRYAVLSYERGEHDTAIRFFKKAMSLIPSEKQAFLEACCQYLGYSYFVKKEYGRAERIVKKGLEIRADPRRRANLFLTIVQVLFARGRAKKAIEYALKILQEPLDQEYMERVYSLLAMCYFSLRDEEQGEQYRRKLIELNPRSPYLNDLL